MLFRVHSPLETPGDGRLACAFRVVRRKVLLCMLVTEGLGPYRGGQQMKWDSLTTVLQEYQGILGAIAGVVFTLITTSLLRFTGKTICRITKWRLQKLYFSIKHGDTLDDLASLEVHLSVDLFNPSDVPRGLRDFSVAIGTSTGVAVAAQHPKDEATGRTMMGGPFMIYDEVRVVNIYPHSFQALDLAVVFSREAYPLLFQPGSYVVKLAVVDPRGHRCTWAVGTYDVANLGGPTITDSD